VSVTTVFTASDMLSVSSLITAQIWPLITQVRWLPTYRIYLTLVFNFEGFGML
jgi:hypothetical protein